MTAQQKRKINKSLLVVAALIVASVFVVSRLVDSHFHEKELELRQGIDKPYPKSNAGITPEEETEASAIPVDNSVDPAVNP